MSFVDIPTIRMVIAPVHAVRKTIKVSVLYAVIMWVMTLCDQCKSFSAGRKMHCGCKKCKDNDVDSFHLVEGSVVCRTCRHVFTRSNTTVTNEGGVIIKRTKKVKGGDKSGDTAENAD